MLRAYFHKTPKRQQSACEKVLEQAYTSTLFTHWNNKIVLITLKRLVFQVLIKVHLGSVDLSMHHQAWYCSSYCPCQSVCVSLPLCPLRRASADLVGVLSQSDSVLHYVHYTMLLRFLFLPSSSTLELWAFSDIDWAGDQTTRHSGTDFYIFRGDSLPS